MPTTNDAKKIKLIKYAERLPINNFPGLTAIMSIDSRYIRASNNMLQLLGYESQKQIFNTTYANIPSPVSENAASFEQEDQMALEQEIKTLSYNDFGEWKILLGNKKPIFLYKDVIGIFANFIDVTSTSLIDLGKFLLEENHKIKKKQFSYIIQDSESNFYNLTPKEQECLFFYIRGLTYKEIAKILNIGSTTAHTHIEHVKQKFNVFTRSQLVEKALHIGFLSIIPESLLKR